MVNGTGRIGNLASSSGDYFASGQNCSFVFCAQSFSSLAQVNSSLCSSSSSNNTGVQQCQHFSSGQGFGAFKGVISNTSCNMTSYPQLQAMSVVGSHGVIVSSEYYDICGLEVPEYVKIREEKHSERPEMSLELRSTSFNNYIIRGGGFYWLQRYPDQPFGFSSFDFFAEPMFQLAYCMRTVGPRSAKLDFSVWQGKTAFSIQRVGNYTVVLEPNIPIFARWPVDTTNISLLSNVIYPNAISSGDGRAVYISVFIGAQDDVRAFCK